MRGTDPTSPAIIAGVNVQSLRTWNRRPLQETRSASSRIVLCSRGWNSAASEPSAPWCVPVASQPAPSSSASHAPASPRRCRRAAGVSVYSSRLRFHQRFAVRQFPPVTTTPHRHYNFYQSRDGVPTSQTKTIRDGSGRKGMQRGRRPRWHFRWCGILVPIYAKFRCRYNIAYKILYQRGGKNVTFPSSMYCWSATERSTIYVFTIFIYNIKLHKH